MTISIVSILELNKIFTLFPNKPEENTKMVKMHGQFYCNFVQRALVTQNHSSSKDSHL